MEVSVVATRELQQREREAVVSTTAFLSGDLSSEKNSDKVKSFNFLVENFVVLTFERSFFSSTH